MAANYPVDITYFEVIHVIVDATMNKRTFDPRIDLALLQPSFDLKNEYDDRKLFLITTLVISIFQLRVDLIN